MTALRKNGPLMGRSNQSLTVLAAAGLGLFSMVSTFVFWPSFFVIQGVALLGIAIYWLVQVRKLADPNPVGIFVSGCSAEFAFICATEPFVKQSSITNELFWLAFGTAASGSIALAYGAWRKRLERNR